MTCLYGVWLDCLVNLSAKATSPSLNLDLMNARCSANVKGLISTR